MGEGLNQFRTTCWSTVLGAAQQGTTGHDSALAKLCEDYYSPLLEFARYWLKSPDDAADLHAGPPCWVQRSKGLRAMILRWRSSAKTTTRRCWSSRAIG